MLLISLCFVCIVICLYYGDRHLQLMNSKGISLIDSTSKQKGVQKYIWTFIGILTLFSAVRHGFIDTYAYREMYRESRFNWDYVWTGAGWGIESGWLITCYLLNYICPSSNFILLLAALLINYAYAKSIEKYSEDITLSLWMFFCLNWLDTNNGLRQFTAAALSIIALPLLLNQERDLRKKILCYIGYILIITIGMQWHNSVKVCIPIMIAVLGKPMNWKTWGVMLLCMAFIAGMNFAMDIFVEGAGDTKYVEMYLKKSYGGMGLPRAIVMGFVPLFFVFSYLMKGHQEKQKIHYVDGILINLLVIHSAFTILGLIVQVLSRLCFYTYFVYFLIMPKLMMNVLSGKYNRYRNFAFVCLTFYFWYNVYVNCRYHAIEDFYFDVEF